MVPMRLMFLIPYLTGMNQAQRRAVVDCQGRPVHLVAEKGLRMQGALHVKPDEIAAVRRLQASIREKLIRRSGAVVERDLKARPCMPRWIWVIGAGPSGRKRAGIDAFPAFLNKGEGNMDNEKCSCDRCHCSMMPRAIAIDAWRKLDNQELVSGPKKHLQYLRDRDSHLRKAIHE